MEKSVIEKMLNSNDVNNMSLGIKLAAQDKTITCKKSDFINTYELYYKSKFVLCFYYVYRNNTFYCYGLNSFNRISDDSVIEILSHLKNECNN